jgi:two-component system, chemotaxis family, protein-glutamate methylesterase/glutaminase
VLVQDPAEAEFAGMPAAALAAAPGARAVSVRRLAREIRNSLQAARSLPNNRLAYEARMEADMDMIDSEDPAFLREDESRLTRLTCPDCGGSMAQVDLPQISYFRCHVGHQFGPQTLAAAQTEASEKKLWSAVAALEEQASVLRYLHRTSPRTNEAGSPDQGETSIAPDRNAEEIASRAAALRAQVRAWSNHPRELETKAD